MRILLTGSRGQVGWELARTLSTLGEVVALDAPEKLGLVAIPTADYPTPAKHPLNSRLDNGKLARAFGIRLPDWPEALRLCVDK